MFENYNNKTKTKQTTTTTKTLEPDHFRANSDRQTERYEYTPES